MNPYRTLSSNRAESSQRPFSHRNPSCAIFKVGLCAAALACAPAAWATLADYQTAVTNTPGIISFYTFEQSTAADAWGTNNGTLAGTTAFATGAAGAGTALQLEGTGRVNLGVVPDFYFEDTTGTVETWVQAGNLAGANATIFGNRDGATRYSIHMNSDKGGIGMWNGAAYLPTVPIPNAGTTWHHLVTVFDFGELRVYWDGQPAGSVTRILGYTDPVRSTQLGSSSPNIMSEGWVGMLDEVAFYSEALTADTILAHYQSMFAGLPPEILAQPKGGTYLAAIPLTLSVKAKGPNLAYQWYKGATALTGKTDSTLSFASLTASDAGTYSVTITNVAGVVPSAPAVIVVTNQVPAALARYQTAVSNETSLISYYTFDRLAPEDVFGENEGILAGTAGWNGGIGGGAGQGLMLDGVGHVNLGPVSAFEFTSGGTVEGWVRADWLERTGYPVMFANRDGGTIWSVHMAADKKWLTCYNGSASVGYQIPGAGAGTNWHHVAAVFNTTNAIYYWDGVVIASNAITLGTGPANVQLGSSASLTTAEGWEGMLDEVAFYSTPLSGSAIQAHYNAYFQGDPPVVTAQPTGGYFLTGRSHTLAVSASGADLHYQWYKDGVMVPSATNSTLSSANLTAAHSGVYYVTITNLGGSTNSTSVTVRVGSDMPSYQAVVRAETNLLSYYTFDKGDAQDDKNAHPGTIVNVVNFDLGPGGITNQSILLDGTGHIDLGQVAEFDFVNGGTVEGWIRPIWSEVPAYDPCIFADRNGGSVWSVHMERWKNLIGNWNGDRFQTVAISGANGWHHYAITFAGGKVHMYWDGLPIGMLIQDISFSSGRTTQLGSVAPGATTDGWMGNLDEVAFYSGALSAEKIWSHYLAMVAPEAPAPAIGFALSGKQLTLSWPAEVSGFTLQWSPDLTPGSWTAVEGVSNNQVTVDVSSGRKFYRLVK
jgi:hypothetical protein